MGVVIPNNFALLSVGTKTPEDPEVMYWTCGVGGITGGEGEDLPAFAAEAWNGSISTVTSETVDLVHVMAKFGPNQTGPTYEWVGEIPGNDDGALLPPNCAVLVRKITGLGGRKQRGRAYLPGVTNISDSLSSAGVFSSAAAAAITTAVEGFFEDIDTQFETESVTPVLLHSDSTLPTVITAFSTDTKLATQRRRLRG